MADDQVQPDPKEPEASSNGGKSNGLKKGLDALTGLAEIAIPGLIPEQKGPVTIFFVVAIVLLTVIVGAGVFSLMGETATLADGSSAKSSNWTFWALLAFMVLAAVIVRGFAAVGNRKNVQEIDALNQVLEKKWWSRSVPVQPLPSDERTQDLIDRLNGIRIQAHSWLSQHNGSGDPPNLEDVRANVFLPRYKDAEEGVLCRLFMDNRLKIGMDGHPDGNVTFLPGEGATGLVFQKLSPRTARFLETEDGARKWEDPYVLTDQQLEEIHPDLRWVISLPLKRPGTPEVMGVLNVDCLNHMYDPDVLKGLSGELLERYALFGAKLAKLPEAKISVLVEEGK